VEVKFGITIEASKSFGADGKQKDYRFSAHFLWKMSGKKGVVFDFNGTLFRDDKFHEKAWNETSVRVRGIGVSDADKEALRGLNNKLTVEWLKGGPVTDEEAQLISDQKEILYRRSLLDQPDEIKLAPGACDLLDFLNSRGIRCAIASMCGKDNMDFYIEHFRLDKWFSRDLIVYDTGDLPSKPDPAIYLRALERLGLRPEDCIALEDSEPGIKAAVAAGISIVYGVSPGEKGEGLKQVKGVSAVISDFSEVDRNLFLP
jgi:beta-phosphoglucomutase-like phosphatase (HAD superfamily)